MVYVAISIIALIVIYNLVFLLQKTYKGQRKDLIKRGVLPGQLYIYDKLIKGKYSSRGQVKKDREILGKVKEEEIRIEYGKRLTWANLIILLGCIGVIVIGADKSRKVINKPGYYDGDKEVNITVNVKDDGGGYNEEDISIHIEAYRMSEESFEELVENVVEYIYAELPGENESIDEISKPINMVTSYPENEEVSIEWVTDEDGYVDSRGNIDEFPRDGDKVIELLAIISCHGYEATVPINICLLQKVKSDKESLEEQIQLFVDVQNEDKNKQTIELPKEIDGLRLSYQSEDNHLKRMTLLVMSFVASGVLIFGKDYDDRKKAKKLREGMEKEYSHIISKLVLLMKSGMSIARAWRKIALDGYEREYGERNVYEMMVCSVREMDSGVAFQTSVKNFAIKTQCESYIRLITYINQNISKGTDTILHTMELEMMKSANDRKNAILEMGEKAGTKMVFPMTVLLIIVLGITIVPGLIFI